MKALVAPSYGPLEQLVVTDVPTPVPGPREILIRVEAAALNPLDAALVVGAMRDVFPVAHPFVVGMDASGVVAAVGADVTGYAAGDPVLAHTHFHPGTLAEYTTVAEGPAVARRPAGLDPARAAALVSTALTGECVVDALGPGAGRTVLVIGATGGVGSFTVQLASRAGLRVLATARPDDAAYARALGAAEVIDHTATDTVREALRLAPQGVDAVVDLVNRDRALAGSAVAVRPAGRLVSTLTGPDEFPVGVGATYVRMAVREGRLQALAERVATGDLTVEVTATYALADAPKALAEFAAGRHTRGKVVVTV
ncbi:NADP-dependent oxidoreductase [Streptomyces avicenniae]|uniref:NADP-dependent oxidoreductase n=1 Tax=Streptomyces avicenniae TaxID=500153 RepID=UPI00069A90BE|nr:NADP-dependent oxidoreductase [Streptomyces avicenniae]